MFEISLSLVSLFINTQQICRPPPKLKKNIMARYGAESATFGGVVFKRAKIWGGCFGYWKIQNGPSVFYIDPLHGLIWPRCKGQFSPKFWYQNSPISVGLNWPQKQYHSGLTHFGPIFGAKLALFILQCIQPGRKRLFLFQIFRP